MVSFRKTANSLYSSMKDAVGAFKEHFTPLDSFGHVAHMTMLHYHDKVGIRLDRFKAGNHVDFHDTVFSDKIQIRAHAKEAWSDFKVDRKRYESGEKISNNNRKLTELSYRKAREETLAKAVDIQMRSKNGSFLQPGERKFLGSANRS